ncbi:glycosyl hydrolase family 76 protein [Arthrobacter crystallopoietes BAB-32]|uniref:Glycosyl hydrolase family 76 protein n=1 Tax=Arthrobacter crystallopoietes BAB-32 TaxID=1246476 RepID=N1URX8_9MICC|nr:glycoside hydrolase family 76 protein [Arthrobacter crystallopoietes]EMY33171.1 glycosyl hydrolase family 76 protein [Arthrobacter crystallopoietes BAB-32]
MPESVHVPDHRAAGAVRAAGRADEAAAAVIGHFGHRLFGLPFTHLGAVARPAQRLWPLGGPWHYWWQAHYLDCLVDAGRRELEREQHYDGAFGLSAGALGGRVLGTIWLRNFLRFTNSYYDDMAWLALAAGRLDALAEAADKPRWLNRRALRALGPALESAHTQDLGGGLWWNTKRDFKNTPATAPAALFFARTGQRGRAAELVDWLRENLYDAGEGLYRDGLRLVGGSPVLVPDIYTYNQGPVLGALLELGRPQDLEQAEALIAAVAAKLTTQHEGRPVLKTHGDGDGGLFTGILARYLALAAESATLPEAARSLARSLVANTADAFWAGRRFDSHRSWEVLVFSKDPAVPAKTSYPPGEQVELSTQLQAWMVLEAAALRP